MAAEISVEKVDGAAHLIMSRPPGNTLTTDFMLALTDSVRTLTTAKGSARPRALVLRSAIPSVFSLGVDPRAVVESDMAGRKRIFLVLADMVEAVWFGYIPVITDINGPAMAGGAVLASLGDFVLMDEKVGKICWSETKVGLPVPGFVQYLARRRMLPASYGDVMLLGRNITAHEAVRIGLASQAYNSADERAELLGDLLGRLARLSPGAVSGTLRQDRRDDIVWMESFRARIDDFADFLTDENLKGGLGALLGKS